MLVLLVMPALLSGGPAEVPPPAAAGLPILSTRERMLAGVSGMSFTVDGGGGAVIALGQSTFRVTSAFSEPGPRRNNLTAGGGAPAPGQGWRVTVDTPTIAGTITRYFSTKT